MNDLSGYNERMASSILDKLFFMHEIDEKEVDTIVDFGCANAELFKQLPYSWTRNGKTISINFKDPKPNNWKKIGIDNSPEMLEQAILNFPDAEYFCSFDRLKIGKNTLLNLSSVIHEIYSYCDLDTIDEFWHNVFHKNFKYISIRDLMVSEKTNRAMNTYEKSVLKRYSKESSQNKKMLDDFRHCYAEVRVRDMLHFMQKNRYVDNWDRECPENYFPITVEYLLSLIPKNKYQIIYLNTYCLEYVKNRIKEDFDYNVKDSTHIQIILQRID